MGSRPPAACCGGSARPRAATLDTRPAPWAPGRQCCARGRAAEQGTRQSRRATRLSGEWAARGATRERATPPADRRSARSGRQVHALVVLSPRGEGRAGQRGGRGGGGEDEATRRDRLRVRTAWVLNRVHFKNSAAPVNLITAATIWRFVEMFYFAVRFKSLEHASQPSGRPRLGAPRCPGPEEGAASQG